MCIDWGGLPRDSQVTFYLPQIDVDETLRYAGFRNGPPHLTKAGAGTIRCKVADVSFIPIPGPFATALPGLMSVQLPPDVTKGQKFTVVVRQIDGRTFRVIGTFQFDIHVKTAVEILPRFERNLSVLKHIALSIPQDNRWYPVFQRYLQELGDRVRALGTDPGLIHPSTTGDGRTGSVDGSTRKQHTGRISELSYDCFGAFQSFVLESCGDKTAFRVHQCGIEKVLRRACKDHSRITLVSEGGGNDLRIVGIEVHCC